MLGANNDNVTSKDLIIDFYNKNTEEKDIEKKWDDYILLPTLDIKPLGSGKLCEFDIFGN